MALLPGTPSVRELIIEALVERLKMIRPPEYHFDIEGRVYDIEEPSTQLPKPSVFIGIGKEEADPEDANIGTYRRRCPVIVTFEDEFGEISTPGPSLRMAKGLRFIADIQRTVPLSFSVNGHQVTVQEIENEVFVNPANDLIEGYVLYRVEYDTSLEDPRVEVVSG